MALPSSGQITSDMIRTELGIPSQANFSLYIARTGGYVALNPCSPSLPPTSGQAKHSDWYGYSHSANRHSGLVTYNGTLYYFGSVNITVYKNGSVYAQRGPANGNYSAIYMANAYTPGDTIRVTASGTPTTGGSINAFAYSVDGVETDCIGTLDTGTITITCGHNYQFYISVGETPASGFHDVLISPVATFLGYDGAYDRYGIVFQATENVNTNVSISYSFRTEGSGSWTSGMSTQIIYSGNNMSSSSDYGTVIVGNNIEIRIDSITPTDDGSTQHYIG